MKMVVQTEKFEKAFQKLDQKEQRRVSQKIVHLALGEKNCDIKKIHPVEDFGDFELENGALFLNSRR